MSDLGPVFLFLKARKLDKIPAWSSILPNEISSKNHVTPLLCPSNSKINTDLRQSLSWPQNLIP